MSEVYEETGNRIRQTLAGLPPVRGELRTNARVMAKVTDGIYRRPGSALRELLANAYDADATWVAVKTDAPQFRTISIEDDGNGMNPEALAYLLENIGGSAKRSEVGAKLGVADQGDHSCSPEGRRLIGRLGIGLFSVSQLTRSFTIVTKTSGSDSRTFASIHLSQFSDHEAAGSEGEFKAGDFEIWQERASDLDAHGTTIVLKSLRPQAIATLSDDQRWTSLANALADEGKRTLQPPAYYVGAAGEGDTLAEIGAIDIRRLPWESPGSPNRIASMIEAVWDETKKGKGAPSLSRFFDYYLESIWQLSLSLPLPYAEGGIESALSDPRPARVFEIAPPSKAARAVETATEDIDGSPWWERLLVDSRVGSDFEVTIDGVRLARPIKFSGLPTTTQALKTPLLFIGGLDEDFRGVPVELTTGPLRFTAYMLWNPVIAPVEHRGALIRIHGASGTLFDPKFLDYRIAEGRRLSQLTCEIFVTEGLEAALNIDRESFNAAHPHTVMLTRWFHSALLQFTNTHKRLSAEAMAVARQSRGSSASNRHVAVIERAFETLGLDADAGTEIALDRQGENGAGTFTSTQLRESIRDSAPRRNPSPDAAAKFEAIARLLDGAGALDSFSEQDRLVLLGALLEILEE